MQEANQITCDKVQPRPVLFHPTNILVYRNTVNFPAEENSHPGPGRPRPDHDRADGKGGGLPASVGRHAGGAAVQDTLGAILVMWAVATLVFFMLRVVPGDPIAAMLFDVADPAAEQIRQKFGLDQPIYVQYVKWFALALQGDLGTSLLGHQIEVARIIREAMPRTLSLASLSFVIAR